MTLINSIKDRLFGVSLEASDTFFAASTQLSNALDQFIIESPELTQKKEAQRLAQIDLALNEGPFKSLSNIQTHFPVATSPALTPQERITEGWNGIILSVQHFIHYEISQPLIRYSLQLPGPHVECDCVISTQNPDPEIKFL